MSIVSVLFMSLEEEMHHEAKRLEKEIKEIDDQLEKLHDKVFHLLGIRQKNEHDLKTLKGSFNESYDKEIEDTIEKILKGRQKAKA